MFLRSGLAEGFGVNPLPLRPFERRLRFHVDARPFGFR
jgi:hypothetical protein